VNEDPALLAAAGARRIFPGRGGAVGKRGRPTTALDGVDYELHAGEMAALVGRSGSGKTTLVRLLAGLDTPDEGVVLYGGAPLSSLSAVEWRAFRRAVQIVFQDPASSLDPRVRVGASVGEPLVVHRLATGRALSAAVARLLEAVGLPASAGFASRLPHELSGGERQRVAIARALALQPRILLLDEPVASLDVSVRGQVMNLLLDLRARLGLTMLLVAHDLALVGGCCERVTVLLRGRIVEAGPTDLVLRRPLHPYTRRLLEAGKGSTRLSSASDPGGVALGIGCRYLGACPRGDARCRVEPALEAGRNDQRHRAACWHPYDGETRETRVT
jgi:peptide/nickel transport system ATP-binding protein